MLAFILKFCKFSNDGINVKNIEFTLLNDYTGTALNLYMIRYVHLNIDYSIIIG